MASARDEHDTVPPPAGEEDAYSAATKVGAMPAELMARLRAEGLLPEEDPAAQRPPPSRPAAAPRAPAPAYRQAQERNPFEDLPNLGSEPPAASSRSPVPAPHAGHPPPNALPFQPPPPVETPVAFASPPSVLSVAPRNDEEAAPLSGKSVEAVRAFGGRSKLRTIAVVVGAVIALVGFAFVMALLSQRR